MRMVTSHNAIEMFLIRNELTGITASLLLCINILSDAALIIQNNAALTCIGRSCCSGKISLKNSGYKKESAVKTPSASENDNNRKIKLV